MVCLLVYLSKEPLFVSVCFLVEAEPEVAPLLFLVWIGIASTIVKDAATLSTIASMFYLFGISLSLSPASYVEIQVYVHVAQVFLVVV